MVNDPTTQPRDPGGSRSAAFVLVPAATFLVGLLLGAALVWVAGPDQSTPDDEPRTETSPTAPASPSTPAAEDLVIPADCVQAVESAREVVDRLRQAVDAVSNLDTERLLDILDELERLDRQIREDASECRPRSTSTPSGSP